MDMARGHKKFLFENAFDDDFEGNEPGDFAGGQVRVYTAAEFNAARQAAYAEGRAAGAADAVAETEQVASRAFAAIAGGMNELAESQRRAQAAVARDSLDCAVAIVRKLLPQLARRHGLDEVAALCSDCLQRLADEPRIVIRVADDLLDAVRQRLAETVAETGFDGKLVFLGEAGLGPDDCRIEWAEGGIERDGTRLWGEIDDIIAGAAATIGRPATAMATEHHQIDQPGAEHAR